MVKQEDLVLVPMYSLQYVVTNSSSFEFGVMFVLRRLSSPRLNS